ncbi:MAG: Kef-type K+ transport system membrane component KefB [Myxococcota bacterium]|jgi:Kef-type K+ transport system membrane component KefB
MAQIGQQLTKMIPTSSDPILSSLFMLGILLASGMLCGWLAHRFKLPTLTGYLAAGIGVKYFAHHMGIDHAGLEMLRLPINDFAMALALFVLGGQFKRRPNAKTKNEQAGTMIRASIIESLFTFTIVGALCSVAMHDFKGGLLLGVLSIAVAPATTLEVLNEFGAKGKVTRTLKMLTALSNVWAIFTFELAMLVLFTLSGDSQVAISGPIWDAIGSVLYGLVAGHILILLQERLGAGNYVVPLLVVILLTIGFCELTDVPHMLAFLVTGAVVANRSSFFGHITKSMDGYAQPAFVLFFVLSGTHLQFSEIKENWLIVGLYVLGRVIGKIIGTNIGFNGLRPAKKLASSKNPPIGTGLLCQAGAAIALAGYVARYNPALSETLLAIVLGAVVIFELIGPLLVKRVVIAAGEVDVGHLLSRNHTSSNRSSWFGAIKRTLRSKNNFIGGDPSEVLIRDIMKPSATALQRSDSMDKILLFANRSPFNHFPVVGDDNVLLGVIVLQDLSEVAYDHRIANLITAEDVISLTTEQASLSSESSLSDALAFFQDFPGNTVAVVSDSATPTLCGMLERTEVLNLARRFHAKATH